MKQDESKGAIESVWDYPRPPRLEATSRRLRLVHAGVVIGETERAMRVLETSHPPVFYLPQADLRMDLLRTAAGRGSFCEFKGVASYWDLDVGGAVPMVQRVAWSYASPSPAFAPLRDHLAFYASKVEECTVDGERVEAQPGDFYGGWITSAVRGPFKGLPGSQGW